LTADVAAASARATSANATVECIEHIVASRAAPPPVQLIPRRGGSIVPRMNESTARTAVDAELKRLERRIDELVATVGQLKEENRALRQRQDSLMTERANLLQKNEQVRGRVEAMIGRLKAMEHGS